MEYKIIISDDQAHVLGNFKDKLESHLDLNPTLVQSGSEVIRLIQKSPYDYAVVVLDFHFEEENINGADIAKALFRINPDLIVIVCTGDSTAETPITCLKAGVRDYVRKGEGVDSIIATIRKYCQKYDETYRSLHPSYYRGETTDSKERLVQSMGMIGRSQALFEVAQMIQRMSDNNSDSTVLVCGESGTGKELVARAIHAHSNRKNGRFVAINSGSIPSDLLESELFGHERGAFTGAHSKKIGRLQFADGGTVFLDEIGDMPMNLQVKLLRFLQQGTIEPLGSNKSIKLDIRIIAATHIDLEQAVKEGRFREDLYYRLNVVPICVPPLRQRTEDIELLAMHFLSKNPVGKNKRIRYKVIQYFENYHWRGNIRELENTIEYICSMGIDGDEIDVSHLSAKFFDKEDNDIEDFDIDYVTFNKRLEVEHNKLKSLINNKERQYFLRKIRQFKSVRSAAREMGIAKSTLHDKLKSWGLKTSEITESS